MNRRAWMVLVVAVAGCRPEKPDQRPEERPPEQVTKSRSATGDEVVARIGSRAITLGEVEDRLAALPVFVRVRYQAPERKIEFLEAYLEFQVLALAAQARGLAQDPEVVDAVKADLVERLLAERSDVTVRTADIPEDAIHAYWDAHPEEFRRPAQVRVWHARMQDEAQAGKVAFRIRRTVEIGEGDVPEAVARLIGQSTDDEATRKTAGDLGFFPRVGAGDRPVPALVEEAAARLDEHQVAGPIKAEDGWHVLFAASRRPAIDIPFDQARPRIVAALMDTERDRRRVEVVERALAAADVKVDDAAVRAVVAALVADRAAPESHAPEAR